MKSVKRGLLAAVVLLMVLSGCGKDGVTNLTFKFDEVDADGLVAKVSGDSTVHVADVPFVVEPGSKTISGILYWTGWVSANSYYLTRFNNTSGDWWYSTIDSDGSTQVESYMDEYPSFTDSTHYNQFTLNVEPNKEGSIPLRKGADTNLTVTLNWNKTATLGSEAGLKATVTDTDTGKVLQVIDIDDTTFRLEYDKRGPVTVPSKAAGVMK